MPDVFPPGFGGTATAGSLTASQTEEATECYKLLAPYNATLLEAVREYIAQHVRRSASVSIKTACENFIVKRECLGKNPMLTDQFGDTYTLAASTATSSEAVAVHYATIPFAESPTVTVSFTSSAAAPEIEIYEFSGIAGIDSQVTNSNTSVSITSGSLTTSNPGDLLFGACTVGIVTAGEAGWQITVTPDYNSIEWLLPNSAGTYQATWTQRKAYPYVATLVAFKP